MASKGTLSRFDLPKDSDGDAIPAIPLIGYSDQVDLSPFTGKVVPVPAGATTVYFSPSDKSANFKVQTGTTVVWSGDIQDGTAPVTNPDMRYLGSSVTSFSIESDKSQVVGYEFGTN